MTKSEENLVDKLVDERIELIVVLEQHECDDNDDEDDTKLSAEEKLRKLNKRRIQLIIYEWDDILCTQNQINI